MNLVLVLFIGSYTLDLYTLHLLPYTLPHLCALQCVHVPAQLCMRACVRACAVVDRVCYTSGLTV